MLSYASRRRDHVHAASVSYRAVYGGRRIVPRRLCRMTRAHWVFLVCDNDFVVCSSAALDKPPGLIPRFVVCAFSQWDSESEGPIKVIAEGHTYPQKIVLKHRKRCAGQDRHFQFFASSHCRRCSEPCLKTHGYFFEGSAS